MSQMILEQMIFEQMIFEQIWTGPGSPVGLTGNRWFMTSSVPVLGHVILHRISTPNQDAATLKVGSLCQTQPIYCSHHPLCGQQVPLVSTLRWISDQVLPQLVMVCHVSTKKITLCRIELHQTLFGFSKISHTTTGQHRLHHGSMIKPVQQSLRPITTAYSMHHKLPTGQGRLDEGRQATTRLDKVRQ